jgi:hypothetical protein
MTARIDGFIEGDVYEMVIPAENVEVIVIYDGLSYPKENEDYIKQQYHVFRVIGRRANTGGVDTFWFSDSYIRNNGISLRHIPEWELTLMWLEGKFTIDTKLSGGFMIGS